MKKSVVVIISICFLLFTSIAFGGVKINPEKVYQEAQKAYADGDYQNAIHFFEQAIKTGLHGDKLNNAKEKLQFSEDAAMIPDSQGKELKDFYDNFKMAVLQKNLKKVREMMHPLFLSSIAEEICKHYINEKYYSMFSKEIEKETIDFRVFHNTPIPITLPDRYSEQQKELLKKLYFPVLPERVIDIRYDFSEESSASAGGMSLGFAKHNGKWKLVDMCLPKD